MFRYGELITLLNLALNVFKCVFIRSFAFDSFLHYTSKYIPVSEGKSSSFLFFSIKVINIHIEWWSKIHNSWRRGVYRASPAANCTHITKQPTTWHFHFIASLDWILAQQGDFPVDLYKYSHNGEREWLATTPTDVSDIRQKENLLTRRFLDRSLYTTTVFDLKKLIPFSSIVWPSANTLYHHQ